MLNSQNTLGIGQTGNAKSRPAKKTTEIIPKVFIAPIILEGEGKTRDLTLKIVSPCVFITIRDGDTETNVIVTPSIWNEDWGNKPLTNLKSERINTESMMIN